MSKTNVNSAELDPRTKAAAEKAKKIEEQRYQETLLEDEFYYGELTRPLADEEIADGALKLAENTVSLYRQIEALNELPESDRVNAPLWLKRSQPDKFKNDEFTGEDVQAYYRCVFTKNPQAYNVADYGVVGVGIDDLLADRMSQTIQSKKWGFYSYSTGGHWVLLVVSPDKQVTHLNSMGIGEIGINPVIQADIRRAFQLAGEEQFGKTHSLGLNTQVGAQCGLHSVLAAEEILKKLAESPKNRDGSPFLMRNVLEKCKNSRDPLHKKPDDKTILIARWNASSEQFKDQRGNAYEKLIAIKEKLIEEELLSRKNAEKRALIENFLMHSHGNFFASEVAVFLEIELSPEGEKIVKEIEALKSKKEAWMKEGIQAFRVAEPKPPVEQEDFFQRAGYVHRKKAAELVRKSVAESADEIIQSKEVKSFLGKTGEIKSFLDVANIDSEKKAKFLAQINEEEVKKLIAEELRNRELKRGTDLANLEALKENFYESRLLLKEGEDEDIHSMTSEDIVNNTLSNYQKILRNATVEQTAEILGKILDKEEYRSHETGLRTIKETLCEGNSKNESENYSGHILSDSVEIEGMKSVGENKIELNLRDKEGENEPVVIDISENRLLEVSLDGGQVQIKVEDFKKELMDYYKGEESYAVGEDGKAVELKKDALEVLRIYQAVPSTSVALRSVSHVVGGLSKPR